MKKLGYREALRRVLIAIILAAVAFVSIYHMVTTDRLLMLLDTALPAIHWSEDGEYAETSITIKGSFTSRSSSPGISFVGIFMIGTIDNLPRDTASIHLYPTWNKLTGRYDGRFYDGHVLLANPEEVMPVYVYIICERDFSKISLLFNNTYSNLERDLYGDRIAAPCNSYEEARSMAEAFEKYAFEPSKVTSSTNPIVEYLKSLILFVAWGNGSFCLPVLLEHFLIIYIPPLSLGLNFIMPSKKSRDGCAAITAIICILEILGGAIMFAIFAYEFIGYHTGLLLISTFTISALLSYAGYRLRTRLDENPRRRPISVLIILIFFIIWSVLIF